MRDGSERQASYRSRNFGDHTRYEFGAAPSPVIRSIASIQANKYTRVLWAVFLVKLWWYGRSEVKLRAASQTDVGYNVTTLPHSASVQTGLSYLVFARVVTFKVGSIAVRSAPDPT